MARLAIFILVNFLTVTGACATNDQSASRRQHSERNVLESLAQQQPSSPFPTALALPSHNHQHDHKRRIHRRMTRDATSVLLYTQETGLGSARHCSLFESDPTSPVSEAHLVAMKTPESSKIFASGSIHEEHSLEEAYHMVVQKGGAVAQKRQADAAYSDGNGTITNDCQTAPVYQIQNGTLSVFLSGTQFFYTTNPGVSIQMFVPSLIQGTITQSFTLGSYGEVIWSNPAFDSGQAQFCSMDNGTIYAVFRTAARPNGCLTSRMFLFMASSCARLPEYVTTLVQTQSTVIVSTAYNTVISTQGRTVTTTQVQVSTYQTTYLQTVTSTYQTILAASTVTATYQTTIPASTATATTVVVVTTTQISTSIQPASTVITTYATTQPASTYITTAVVTQSASTITTTYQTTIPASTITATYQTTYPAVTVVQTVVSTAPTATYTVQQTTTASPVTQTTTLPARTVTVTTVSAVASAAAPSLCGNQGMEYAVFANNPTYASTGSGNYNPEFMKAKSVGGTWTTLYYNSTYDTISGSSQYCPNGENVAGTIYGNTTSFNCREFSIDHRFYMYAYMSGTWRFDITNPDDQILTWVGNKALTGWTKANADTNTIYGNTGTFYWTNVTIGTYNPVRIAYGNYGGGASYSFTITDPQGNVAFTSNTRNSPYIVRYSCDGSTAQRFPYLFGQEL